MLGRILKFLGGYFQLYMLEEGHKYYLGGQNYKKIYILGKILKFLGGLSSPQPFKQVRP
jgi:hypothetical protein